MSAHTVCIENDTTLFWQMGSGAVYDENQIGQGSDQLYRCSLR